MKTNVDPNGRIQDQSALFSQARRFGYATSKESKVRTTEVYARDADGVPYYFKSALEAAKECIRYKYAILRGKALSDPQAPIRVAKSIYDAAHGNIYSGLKKTHRLYGFDWSTTL